MWTWKVPRLQQQDRYQNKTMCFKKWRKTPDTKTVRGTIWKYLECLWVMGRDLSTSTVLSKGYVDGNELYPANDFTNYKCTKKVLFSAKKLLWIGKLQRTLYFNEWTENFSLWSKVLCIGKLTVMAEIIFHNRNFSKFDTFSQNSASKVRDKIKLL